jgi:1-acyl-sn-glycerol-3-phosphate acyltransferase
VDVSFGDPISSHGRNPEELTLEVEKWIENEMHRLDHSAYSDSCDSNKAI